MGEFEAYVPGGMSARRGSLLTNRLLPDHVTVLAIDGEDDELDREQPAENGYRRSIRK